MAKNDRNNEEFGEYMPAYMNQAELFESSSEPLDETHARRTIVKQLGWVVLLLAAQVVLFFILINNTLNL